MNSVKSLLISTRFPIPPCHQKRARYIEKAIAEGAPFASLGGQRIAACPSLVRFRLGRQWRLIFREEHNTLVPHRLISRQAFDAELNRRR
ncbi:hypothetical protein [Marinobacterium mangrovicola]|uniref:ParE-like toxin domain-containing protein n=1 Tax=Marinobacterium mangrovicola TaxID=1476959 RepID=A0A4R1GQ52_9GAMM|nr:hypothetical protein [Marinobacterium mangrovicola]TCK09135.1 hypothetical protein CLV83_1238 [Marinobacterium mangrovicola]